MGPQKPPDINVLKSHFYFLTLAYSSGHKPPNWDSPDEIGTVGQPAMCSSARCKITRMGAIIICVHTVAVRAVKVHAYIKLVNLCFQRLSANCMHIVVIHFKSDLLIDA